MWGVRIWEGWGVGPNCGGWEVWGLWEWGPEPHPPMGLRPGRGVGGLWGWDLAVGCGAQLWDFGAVVLRMGCGAGELWGWGLDVGCGGCEAQLWGLGGAVGAGCGVRVLWCVGAVWPRCGGVGDPTMGCGDCGMLGLWSLIVGCRGCGVGVQLWGMAAVGRGIAGGGTEGVWGEMGPWAVWGQGPWRTGARAARAPGPE